ncbi:hypothetical protein CPB97_003885 [Podila verticillata]|nr:hypothetical protein CPB97_003885 [Podila verticillata]
MSDGFPLPIECLQLVIINIAIKHDLKTLASLLRVSKHVCLATLPILYENPLAWFDKDIQSTRGMMTSGSSYNKVLPVIRLLLASVPKDSYTGLLKAVYNIADDSDDHPTVEPEADAAVDPLAVKDEAPLLLTTTPQPWPIDYLSYVHQFHTQDQFGSSHLVDVNAYTPLKPRLKAYVEKHQLAEEYTAIALPVRRSWLGPNSHMPVNPEVVNGLTFNIHREATWALCSTILEQVQTIVIPLSDINRYLDSIARLSSLSVVTFKLDEFADVNDLYMLSVDSQHVKQLSQRKEKQRQDLELAVKFVQMHTIMFRGTLKQVLCPDDRCNWQYNIQSCPADILDRMLAFLPTLVEPTVLVNKNWKQFVAKAEHTNLDHVTMIDVWGRFIGEYYYQLKSKPFLHRCPSLRKYNTISLGPDSFKWAVENLPNNDRDHGQDRDRSQDRHQLERQARPNPPLEDVSITAFKESFGGELDHIGLGFGSTLKSFAIHGYRDQSGPGGGQPVSIGRGWKMPVLSKFVLYFPSEHLVLDPDFLCHCPSLRILKLDDDVRTYDLNNIQVAQPAHLPELTTLVLVGRGALSFHPDTLHSTKELKILYLGSSREFARTFLPSLEAMHDELMEPASNNSDMAPVVHRPKWSWEWHLPALTTLSLSVEFALHFQFQMLQGTPKLEELSLCLYSTVHQVDRVLTEADFLVARDHEQEEEEEEESLNYETDQQKQTSSDPSTDSEELTLLAQPLHVLAKIRSYLDSQTEESLRRQSPPGPLPPAEGAPQDPDQQEEPQPQPQPQPTEQQLQEQQVRHLRMSRETHMSNTYSQMEMHLDRMPGCTHPPGECPNWKRHQERAAELLAKIEELVKTHGLLPQLDTILADMRVLAQKQRKEEEHLKRLRAAHPELLVVASLKKLELFGRWGISDSVLETLLGRVFRNVKMLNGGMWEGYSMNALIRVTQAMPFLDYVRIIDLFDPEAVSEEYRLQPLSKQTIRPPFLNDAADRVVYTFEFRPQLIRGDGSGVSVLPEE